MMTLETLANKSPDRIISEAFVEYRRRLIGFVKLMIHNQEEAEDIVQETFANAWKSFPTYNPLGGATLKTWIYTIAHNNSINYLKSPRRNRKILLLDDDVLIEHGVYDSNEDSFLNNMFSEQIINEVRRAIGDLTNSGYRDVLSLRLGGGSYKEISEELGIPVGSVKSRLSRGKSELKERLEHLRKDL